MPIANTGQSKVLISAPAAKAKELSGTLASSGSFYTMQFTTREVADEFVRWLERRHYQVRTIIPPNEQCKFFLVTYR